MRAISFGETDFFAWMSQNVFRPSQKVKLFSFRVKSFVVRRAMCGDTPIQKMLPAVPSRAQKQEAASGTIIATMLNNGFAFLRMSDPNHEGSKWKRDRNRKYESPRDL